MQKIKKNLNKLILILSISTPHLIVPKVFIKPNRSNKIKKIDPKEALYLAVKFYIYGYPLVLEDTTKRIMINEPSGTPINHFAHARTFPDPNFTDIVTPNVDTLYSMAWLDLSKEPIILHVPNTNGKYYLMEILDGWTNVFASIGKRTSGTRENNFALVGPFWKGRLPKNVSEIKSPTNMAWIIGRIQTNGAQDYKNVQMLQNGFTLTALSEFGKTQKNESSEFNPKISSKMTPVEQTEKMDPLKFFQTLLQLMKENPPIQFQDTVFVNQLKEIGIFPRKTFDVNKLDPVVVQALKEAPEIALKIFKKARKKINLINGWNILTKNVGRYGNNYFLRALIAQVGIGANLPQDAVYAMAYVDGNGKKLNGKNSYLIHFDKDKIPPAHAFWSITIYNNKHFLVPNKENIYAISSHNKLNFNKDGSLDILIQQNQPKQKNVNWLPSSNSNFNLVLRIYWPKNSVILGTWKPVKVISSQIT